MAEEKSKKMTKIVIPSTDEENGDVFVAVNDQTYLIRRDEPVEVPPEVLAVLDDAVIQTVRPDKKGKMVPVTIKRYVYQVVK